MKEQSTSLSIDDEIKNLNFCVMDLETTGGNLLKDKIIEIGLVKIQNLKITDSHDFLINPEKKIPEFIQKLTSISQSDVEEAPTIEDTIDKILEFIGDDILVAHNTSFDIPFFNSVLKRLNRPELKNKTICTNLMTKYLIPSLMNSNLNYMSKIFGIKHTKAHRALDDASAAAQLLIQFLKIFIKKKIVKLNHLYYPRNKYELDRHHFKKDENSIEEIEIYLNKIHTPHLLILKGDNGIINFAYPSSALNSEKKFILEQMKIHNWKNLTVQLIGPYISGLLLFNNLYSKLEADTKSEVMSMLWKTYLPQFEIATENSANEINFEDFGDFLITHHLVPEQLMIYPLGSFSSKNSLVFRYPGHKKKLVQFINSRYSKIKSGKLKPSYINFGLKIFVYEYLKSHNHQKSILLVDANKNKLSPEDLSLLIDQFLEINPNPYNYPKEHI